MMRYIAKLVMVLHIREYKLHDLEAPKDQMNLKEPLL
ncbi:hypothetical protein N482_19975 [Pseudoalteromonas luteoviolacea NCIMB 1942]|uniref:Uncharacterized protein n=1 Tax=Pseudoalteromonas luteoviolacea NCIMB 1942 TaxID=1365253 RepID=A0A166Y8K8_9GAMM|nr:hypothetical protein N482_19975 [Pseudoalteromonas luteoviolacea NCIMB 1942]